MSVEFQEIKNSQIAQPNEEIPRDTSGRIRWLRIDDPARVIRFEVSTFIQHDGKLSPRLLAESGRYDLLNAIPTYYPGSWAQLKKDLGLQITRKPNGFWTQEHTMAEASEFFQTEGELTYGLLLKRDRSNLANAIRKFPGGIRGFRRELGAEEYLRPKGFWTPEQTLEEAKKFIDQEGNLSRKLLLQSNRVDLLGALNRYPGRMSQAKLDLGLVPRVKRSNGYWTPELIEQETIKVFQKEGYLTVSLIEKLGQGALAYAITHSYPGGMQALRERLGISNQKPEESISPEEANEQLRRLLEEEI